MHVILLIITLFYYGLDKPPESYVLQYDDPDECQADIGLAIQDGNSNSDVRDTEATCSDVEQKEKI